MAQPSFSHSGGGWFYTVVLPHLGNSLSGPHHWTSHRQSSSLYTPILPDQSTPEQLLLHPTPLDKIAATPPDQPAPGQLPLYATPPDRIIAASAMRLYITKSLLGNTSPPNFRNWSARSWWWRSRNSSSWRKTA